MSGALFIPHSERVAVAQRRHLEDDLQRGVCKFLRVALPHDALAFAVPNGGMRSKREAARLSGLGLVAGVPDLCLVHRGHALFIELKAPRGAVSAVQRDMHQQLIRCGAEVMVCRSGPEVEASLREAGLPLRASYVA